MRAYRFRIYPSKIQDKEMRKHLWISKELWNKLLDTTVKRYDTEKKFPNKSEFQMMVKDTGLHSQTAQGIAHRLDRALKAKIRAKKQGKVWGFPRFKSFDRMKSLYYPQSGFWLDKKLNVAPFGEINIKKHREIEGKVKTLTIKRESSGKWFAVFCAGTKPETPKINNGGAVGLDLGLINLATLSNGEIIKNPRQFRKFEKELAEVQRRLSKKKRGSQNRKKTRHKVAITHEKIANTRTDYLHKQANSLLSHYSLIAMEDLKIRGMAEQGHGKNIYDASWGLLTNILCYKAESAGSRVVFVDPKDTTKTCSNCGEKADLCLWDRTYNCPSCGLELDRDVNAARNILMRATQGACGSNACGDETIVSSLKQEAMTLPQGRSG